MKRAMVILSGGQDSTTCLFWAKEHYQEVHAITFHYGQRHTREIVAAQEVAKLAGIASHEMVSVGRILRGRSPLVDSRAELELYQDYTSMEATIGNRVELTFVPMRNALFLTLGANIALAKDCFTLVTGICNSDNLNYPDCRELFIAHQEETINAALGINYFRIETPLLNFSKAETVRLAVNLPGCLDALAHSHTCYAGSYPPCGVCHACTLRAHGFNEADIEDPLMLRAAA